MTNSSMGWLSCVNLYKQRALEQIEFLFGADVSFEYNFCITNINAK